MKFFGVGIKKRGRPRGKYSGVYPSLAFPFIFWV
ncbi:hypothetical protein MTY_0166 [Moorella thermoacetica Y72]|uniref:Uncharacterized protein n=1 Tax=Moorella thermoacetica Y72 TaxID=1325331 RepID=A0A0S6UBR0_NEOTH|nr:hypothetical protein MTY_0166 [Moorella thermoacetica Y72]